MNVFNRKINQMIAMAIRTYQAILSKKMKSMMLVKIRTKVVLNPLEIDLATLELLDNDPVDA
jgi:hypothetical protein